VYDLFSGYEWPYCERGLKVLAAAEGESILEIAFGTGRCLFELARAVGGSGRVCGVDLSPAMMQKATARFAAEETLQKRVDLRVGDATQLPYEDGEFDGVFMSFALELLDVHDMQRSLAECRRVLKPGGGRLCIVGMTKQIARGRMVAFYEWCHRNFPRTVDCRPIYVEQAMTAAGFLVEVCEVMPMYGLGVEVVLARAP